jgi:LPLT family lysophospholipid transporter-like MFS transporter
MVQGRGGQFAFVALVLAQLLAACADNALLLVAVGLLLERQAEAWTVPALRIVFYVPVVLLAAYAGALADRFPKQRVIVAANLIKLGGAAALLLGAHPLLAFGLMGLGSAPYGPARFGILPELIEREALIKGNAWLEVAFVSGTLGGVALGGLLLARQAGWLGWLGWPDTLGGLSPALAATACLLPVYALAALASVLIPTGRASDRAALHHPARLWPSFMRAAAELRRDPQAAMSLAVTCLFWSIAAALQFIVLRWATETLGMTLSDAAWLQVALALGIIAGAVTAGRLVRLARCLRILPLGLGIGVLVMLMAQVRSSALASAMLAVLGVMSGLLLVPMNALLQTRGQHLMHPGRVIAVQNFYEHLAALVALAVYGLLTMAAIRLDDVIVGFGATIVLATLALIAMRDRAPLPERY